MGQIGCIRCEKSRRDFAARTFALIALVHPVLHPVSCSYETITNAPKHYTMHQNKSLWSNGVDWISSWRKIPTSLRGTNFCINCMSSPRFAPSFMQLRNNPKCTKILQRSNGVDWVRSLRKIPTWLRGTNFCINCTRSPCFASSFMRLRNDPKCTQTLCDAPKHDFMVQWSGLGAIIAKNPDVTLWHVLLH